MEYLNDLNKYHQKSLMFLYPILDLPSTIKPEWTYMYINGVSFNQDCNLICVFDKHTNKKKIIHEKLIYNKYFDLHIQEDDLNIYIFNLEAIKKDYKLIESGMYSKLSEFLKMFLAARRINPLGISALFPEHSYTKYAEHFNFPIEELYGKELLDAPDKDCETLNSDTIAQIIKDEYYLPSALF